MDRFLRFVRRAGSFLMLFGVRVSGRFCKKRYFVDVGLSQFNSFPESERWLPCRAVMLF